MEESGDGMTKLPASLQFKSSKATKASCTAQSEAARCSLQEVHDTVAREGESMW